MPDWKNEIRKRMAKLNIEPAREAEIVDELAQHLSDIYRELLADGVSESEAKRLVLEDLSASDQMAKELGQRFGGHEAIPAGAAAAGNPFNDLIKDLRYAGRTLRKSPGFTLFVALTLALGIGANTAVFTLINTLLLNPLAVRQSSELVAVETADSRKTAGAGHLLPVSYLNLRDMRERNEVFSDLAGYTALGALTLSRGEATERIFAEFVTGNYFQTLGVRPVVGRFFNPAEDDKPGAVPVAVISYSVWQQRFGAAPDIAGQTLRLNGNAMVSIIGVAPAGFKGVTAIFGPDLWIPVSAADDISAAIRNTLRDRGELAIRAAGRLKPGVTTAQAEANMRAITAALNHEHPELNQDRGIALRPLTEAAQGDTRQPLLFGGTVLMAVVGLVLLIACSNAASLFLARASGRRQEIAVRLALGASRSRLIRQLLTESALLGLISGVFGIGLAYAGCQALWSMRPAEVATNFVDLKMDGAVMAFSFAISLLTGILFGIAPALQASRTEIVEAIKEESHTTGRSRRRVTFRNALLVGQVAFSLVALVTAALFLRSIQRAYTIDPGFQTGKLAVFLTNQGQAGYDRTRAEEFYQNVRTRVGALPGVESVSWSSNMPLWNRASRAISIEGETRRRPQEALTVVVNTVSLDYFATMGIPVLRGRDFTDADRDGTLPVALVNEAMAARYWPSRDAIGGRFQVSGDPVVRQVVGVVKTANYSTLGEEPQPAVYLPLKQNFTTAMILNVRSQGDPAGILTAVQRELRSIDTQIDVSDVRTGAKVVDQALFTAKMGVGLLGVFGALALALASAGLYGTVSYSVSQRRREIGLRVALGAGQGEVLRMVLRQGMTLVGSGVVLGLALAMMAGRAVSTHLFGVSSADPLSLFGASFTLAGVALLACYLPALRAARMDPVQALREG